MSKRRAIRAKQTRPAVPVSAIQLRTIERKGHTYLQVLFRSPTGSWHKIIEYATNHDGIIDHCTHARGLETARAVDPSKEHW